MQMARPPRRAHLKVDEFASSRLRQVLVWLVVLKVVGIVVVFDPAALLSFDLAKSVYSRALEWALVAALAVAILRFGTAIFPRSPLHWLVGAFVLANAISALLGADRYLASFGDPLRFLGLTFVADMAVLYFAVAATFRERRDWLLLGAGIGLALLIAIAYGVVQRLGRDPFAWSSDAQARPFSTLGNADMFGHFLSVSFAAALGVLAFGHWRIVRLVAAVAILASLAMSGIVATRGSILGMVAAVVALGVVALRVYGPRRETLVRLGLLAAATLALLAVTLVATPLGERFQATLAGGETQQRLFLYATSLDLVRARPVFGYGVDSFAAGYAEHRRVEDAVMFGQNSLQTAAHNWILQTAATTGMVGLTAQLALLGVFAWLAWRALPREPAIVVPLVLAAVAYWTHALVSVGAVVVDWVPWVAFGGIAAVSGTRLPARELRHIPLLVPVAALVMGLVGAASGWPAEDANRETLASLESLSRNKVDDAIAHAQQSVRSDPRRSRYWNNLGIALERAGKLKQSGDAYEAAAERSPHIATLWANLGRARAQQAGDTSSGGREAALRAAQRGVKVDPNNPVAQIGLARVANSVGDGDLALGSAAMAIRLFPGDAGYERVASDAAQRASDPAAASATLEELVRLRDSANLRVGLARLALKRDDRAGALAHVRRAIEIDARNQDAQRMLIELGG